MPHFKLTKRSQQEDNSHTLWSAWIRQLERLHKRWRDRLIDSNFPKANLSSSMLENRLLHFFDSSIKISDRSLISSSRHYFSLTTRPLKLSKMTTSNDYDKCLLSHKSSDQSVTFVKLSLKILEPNCTFSEVEDKIHDLNWSFNHLLSNRFNFNKVFPVHKLLSIL